MSDKTGIEWTDATWNPVRGCTRVSEGCRNCYAEGVAHRFSGEGGAYEGLVRIGADGKRKREWSGAIQFVEKHLLDPLRWKKPRRIFVNSMSDLFHPGVTDEMRDRIFAVMALCPHHTFQVLTKRPEAMREYLRRLASLSASYAGFRGPSVYGVYRAAEAWASSFGSAQFAETLNKLACASELHKQPSNWPLPNVWLGVSVENQKAADERIPLLLQTPAAVRFLSCEPLLRPVDLPFEWDCIHPHLDGIDQVESTEAKVWKCRVCNGFYRASQGPLGYARDRPAIDWVIAGGESGKGPNIRPSHPDWFRSLRDQCAAAGVPFFFKQWGEWADVSAAPYEGARKQEEYIFKASGELLGTGADGRGMVDPGWRPAGAAWMRRVSKKAAGDLLDGVRHHAFPEVQRG